LYSAACTHDIVVVLKPGRAGHEAQRHCERRASEVLANALPLKTRPFHVELGAMILTTAYHRMF